MPRVKQVSSKRPANRFGFNAPQSRVAIKSVRLNSSHHSPSSSNLPTVPPRVTQVLKTVNRNTVAERKERATSSRFTEYSIPRKAFQRVCRDISYNYMENCRFTPEALVCLQMAVEDFLVGFFEDASLCMLHAKRKTLMQKDLELVAKLRKFEYKPL